MNYLQRLKAENEALQARIDATAAEIREFRAHLQSAKFQPCEGDTDRRDWIATSDVNNWLFNLRDTLQGAA